MGEKEGKLLSVHTRLKRRRGERKTTHRSETPAFERRRSSANDDDDSNSDRTNRESLVLRSSFVLRKNREALWVVRCGSKKSDFVSDPTTPPPLKKKRRNGTPLVRDGERHRETD